MLFGISADFTDRTKKMKYVNYTMVSGEIFDGVCTKILELYTPGYKYKRPEPGLESEIHIPGKDYDVIMKIDKSLDGTYSYNIGLAGYIK